MWASFPDCHSMTEGVESCSLSSVNNKVAILLCEFYCVGMEGWRRRENVLWFYHSVFPYLCCFKLCASKWANVIIISLFVCLFVCLKTYKSIHKSCIWKTFHNIPHHSIPITLYYGEMSEWTCENNCHLKKKSTSPKQLK